ncbi:2-dehydro-3-deoxygalactonokinase [Ancylobacter sp. 6x-1]|uniref:2-dehydro-3-deoxygalactonokinase n=1 Tax=Ancylobacter crimeensis TaxID=2579147 RepID=A0ABT0DCK1_9HYPH|nr:2-dehydro-3-deoxygalactonokinase [Ancylobacter crimeensis]
MWLLDAAGHVLAERRSAQGLATSGAHGFEVVLESHLAALDVPDGVPVMMCGMVGSRSGWMEAAYLHLPVRLFAIMDAAVPAPSARRTVRILPGLAQSDTLHPDVMRGEETQLFGLATQGHSGLACLPGTHSKWVALDDDTVRGFATFLTGELFQLLRSTSVVAPAVEGGTTSAESAAFIAGVEDALAAPAVVSNALFELRAGWLLHARSPSDTLSRLSGLLIGLEIAGAQTRFGRLDRVALVASGPTAALYERALAVAGTGDVHRFDAESCVRTGLHAAALRAFAPAEGVRT